VIAARAAAIAGVTVHPNDHVNASQSTNDAYPTAMALTILELVEVPVAALKSPWILGSARGRRKIAGCARDDAGRSLVLVSPF
jgi:hypothetical protein